jgi:hypothetical protein
MIVSLSNKQVRLFVSDGILQLVKSDEAYWTINNTPPVTGRGGQ